MLKYSRCGCADGIEAICHGFLCKTVDCNDEQVIPHGESGDGENALGYENTTPIKYTRPISCMVNATVNGIGGGDYFGGLNGSFLLKVSAGYDYSIPLETYKICSCNEENDNRNALGYLSLFLSGPDPENQQDGVTSVEDIIHNDETWSGNRPTIWIKLLIETQLVGPVYTWGSEYTLVGDTGITYNGDYTKMGDSIGVPEPTCSNHINTGDYDCRNIDLSASLTLIEENHACDCPDFAAADIEGLTGITFSSPTVTIQSASDEIRVHTQYSRLGNVNVNAIFPSEKLNFCAADYKVVISSVTDEEDEVAEEDLTNTTCNCKDFLNRTYYGHYTEHFSSINSYRMHDTLCCCEDNGVCIDYMTVTFDTSGAFPISYVKFFDTSGTLLLTYRKIYSASTLDISAVTDMEHTLFYQHPDMVGVCDFSAASVKLSILESSIANCKEVPTGCPTFCDGLQDEVLIRIPSFTLTAFDFTQYYRWLVLASNTYVYSATQPPGTLPDNTWNSYINEFILGCAASTYTFPGGEYILSANGDTCTYTYGNSAACYGADPYIEADLTNMGFSVTVYHKDFIITFDDITQSLPYNVCCNTTLNFELNALVSPRATYGIGERCGNYLGLAIFNQCSLYKTEYNLTTCGETITYPAGFTPTGGGVPALCGGLPCNNGIIRSFSCYNTKNITLDLETI